MISWDNLTFQNCFGYLIIPSNYFFWNYSKIFITKNSENNSSVRLMVKVPGFNLDWNFHKYSGLGRKLSESMHLNVDLGQEALNTGAGRL